MDKESFLNSLSDLLPDNKMHPCLQALWYDRKGHWEKAHAIVQDMNGRDAACVHSFLHRKEGDLGNADYWYSRANKKRPDMSLEEEWEKLLEEFL